MKTPTQYVKMLNNNVITNDIVGQVIYSYNKRAKNYRDKKLQYNNKKDHFGNYEKNEYKEKEFYKKKEDVLKLYNPIEIGNDINDLLSVQFCDKVYMGLMEGNLKIIEEIVAI